MKRILCAALAFLLLLPLVSSCAEKLRLPEETLPSTEEPNRDPETVEAESGRPAETADPATKEPIEQDEKEKGILKIIILGNSHSLDAFQLLPQIFQKEAPGLEVVLAVMYYSGCSISQHVVFSLANEPVYRYNKSVNGQWQSREECTMARALEDEAWDLVILQAAKSDLDEDLNLESRRRLEKFVGEHIPTEHSFAWHTSWPSPNDETFFSADYWRQPPAGYKENLIRLYGFDPVRQFTVLTDQAKKNILTDPTYAGAFCTGAGIMYAHRTLGVPQLDIWRDYTHLNDYGRLIAGYSLYVQITGSEVNEIGLRVVPASLRQAHYRSEGNLMVTDEMARVIRESANHSLHDPWSVPS